MKSFEEFIKEKLKQRGGNQQEMAVAIGISGPQLSRILKGTRGRTPEVVRAIGEFLGVDEIELFRIAEIVLSSPKTDLSLVKRETIHAIEIADEDDVEFINKWLNERREHKKLTFQPRTQK
jgi:transcriptional regulator with XRE-family HTH domain